MKRVSRASLALPLFLGSLVALLVLAAGLAAPATAVTTWDPQTSGTYKTLKAITFADAANGWAFGGAAAGPIILHTGNGGATWTEQTAPSGITNLKDGICLSSTVAWGVGDDSSGFSYFIYTTDGGTTWQKKPVPGIGNAYIHSISFYDALHGWAGSDAGRTADTTDGGVNWSGRSPVAAHLNKVADIDFVSTTTGWACDMQGRVAKSTDGGLNWSPCATPSTQYLGSVEFFDTQNGLVAGSDGVFVTSDGGASWTKQALAGSASGLCFVDSARGWVSGSEAKIYGTWDGGSHWVAESVTTGVSTTGFTDIAYADGHAWACGANGAIVHRVGVPEQPPDLYTKWTKRTSGTVQPVIGLDFVSNKVGWAVGYNGTILKTTDAGVTWKAQASGTTVELCGVDMVDATTGWIVGYDRPNNAAVILKTTDGGATWVPQAHPSPAGAYPADVLAVDAATAFGFGGGIAPGQNLFWTQSGGVGWAIHPNAPSGTNLTSVSRLVGGTAWAVGAQSGLVKTTDSGLTWAKVTHPTNGQERYMGAIALDAATAVVVGDDAPTTEATGLILRTPDGGSTWTTPTLPGTQQLREIDGAAGHLWIVGEGGVVYHSSDAGLTWGKQVLPAGTSGLWNVDCRSPDLICAVGLGGTILTGMRPTATLSRPVAPASVKRGTYFTVTGTLKPRHSGSTPLTFYRKKSGKWVKYKTVNAKNADYSTYTKYKLKYKLPYTGSWYVVASHSCTLHRASVSAKEYLSVK